jgi:hypothetical protein
MRMVGYVNRMNFYNASGDNNGIRLGGILGHRSHPFIRERSLSCQYGI